MPEKHINFFWPYNSSNNIQSYNFSKEILNESALRVQNGSGPGKNLIVGVGSVESSFLTQTVSLDMKHMDPDLAPLMVYIQYLVQLEGPMWKQIRGLGLAYHYKYVITLCTVYPEVSGAN